MLDKKNTKIAVLFGTAGIAVGIAATILFTNLYSSSVSNSVLSTKDCTSDNNCTIIQLNGSRYQIRGESYNAYKNCNSGVESCDLVTLNGTHYILRGEAHQAYLVMDNIASQLHMMKFDSQFVDQRGYLITIEGHNLPEVDRLVKEYNISESLVQLHPTSKDWKSVTGLIFKKDLIRFVEENDADSISAKSLTVTRTGSVTNGTTTVTSPFGYPGGVSDRAIAEYTQFRDQAISQIVLHKSGVTRINDKDLIKVEDQTSNAIP